jgi:hypothetical protein
MSELTGDEDEFARCEASGVKDRDHSTIPPASSKIVSAVKR